MRRFCVLVATLFLIACSSTTSLQPTASIGELPPTIESSPVTATQPTPDQVSVEPTEAPTAIEEAPADVVPTAQAQEPSPEPNPEPSPEPSAQGQADSSYLPPADQVWLRSGSRITSLGPQHVEIDLEALGLPRVVYGLYVSPNGQYAAYIDPNERVNLVSAQGVTSIEVDGQPISLLFSPQSDVLLISTLFMEEQRWLLSSYDLAQGVLSEFASPSEADRFGINLLDWSEAGILIHRVVWASDAPPFALALFVPESKEFIPLFEDSYLSTAITHDLQQLAVSTGYRPIGEEPSFELNLLDRSTGASQVLREQGQGLLYSLSFSPDGAYLFYASTKGYTGEELTCVLYSLASGQSQTFEISYANQQDGLQDAVWQDADTLLVAVADSGKTRVFQLETTNFSSDGLSLLYEQDRSDQQGRTKLEYVPEQH